MRQRAQTRPNLASALPPCLRIALILCPPIQAIGTRVLARTTHLIDGAKDVNMSKDVFLRSILPIGLLFSASLILSNTAYLYLSVAYIQMLKVSTAQALSCAEKLTSCRRSSL